MEQFIKQHHECILGILEGFDRVLFRGTLRSIAYGDGLARFLSFKGIRLKAFKSFLGSCSQQIVQHARHLAEQAGRPYRYVPSPKASKESIAREIAERDGIQRGLICVLSCVEPCRSFSVRWDHVRQDLRVVPQTRKCTFLYFYYMDREFGLMHIRLQTWFSFEVQVCINGRSYLQRQLDREGIKYVKRDNGFLRIDDLPRAQAMLDCLSRRRWAKTLDNLVRPLNPLLGEGTLLGEQRSYYWTIRQSELATDVMFRDEAALGRIYPALCRHVIEHCSGEDVLRFFGKKATLKFTGEVITESQRLVEGVRIRHRLHANSLKMYDKHGSVLRIETTINNPHPFRVLRRAQGDPSSALAWRMMRKGIADTARRVEVSLRANRRYLDALAVVGDPTPTCRVLDPLSNPVTKRGARTRGLRPIAPEDAALFEAILRGEHRIRGFTNGDLQACLFEKPPRDTKERSQRSSCVGRRLRMLRRHGLIRKVGKRRLYRITAKGHQAMTLALALRHCSLIHPNAA